MERGVKKNMYLKQIELQGFKSFCYKQKFVFSNGITGVVGPNGSGKSNLADAVRWVLGEQSAKQLRSTKMEDVIFAGTQLKKPVGFAYVAITFDNRDHKLPLDYEEITVARRVYRSGESEYLLNGAICRRKEIQELFWDTGIGKEGYSIIGQGQIEQILNGKEEERRLLFDEAVGISKFKKRKAMAQKDLEMEQENESRIADILAEMQNQLGPLEEQATVAKQYFEYREQLRGFEILLFLRTYEQCQQQKKTLEEKNEQVASELLDQRQQFEKVKQDCVQLDQKIQQQQEKIEQQREAWTQLRLKKEKIEGEEHAVTQQRTMYLQQNEQLKEQLQSLEQTVAKKETEQQEFGEQKQNLLKQLQSTEQQEKEEQSHLEKIQKQLEDLKQQEERLTAEYTQNLQKIENLKTKLQVYAVKAAQLETQLQELEKRGQEQVEKQDTYEIRLQNEQARLAELKTTIQQLQMQKETYAQQLSVLHQTIAQKKEQKETLDRRYSATSIRLQTISKMMEQYEGYAIAVRKIMEQRKKFPGILGVVSDFIQVPPTYETAIEIALAGSLQNIVTQEEQTAKDCIAYLKQFHLGRATFLPLSFLSVKEITLSEAEKKEAGVIGIASEVVSVKKEMKKLVSHLLGRTLLIDTIHHAVLYVKKYKPSYRVITLEGEQLHPGGAISGGTIKNQTHLLRRNRELNEQKKELEQIANEQQTVREALEQEQAAELALLEKQTDLGKQLQEQDLLKSQIMFTVQQLQQEFDFIKTNQASFLEQKQHLNKQLQEIKEAQKQEQKPLQEVSQTTTHFTEEKEQLKQEINRIQEQEKEHFERYNQCHTLVASLQQKQQFLSENEARLQTEKEQLEAQRLEMETKWKRQTEEVQKLEDTFQQLQQQQSDLAESLKTQEQRIQLQQTEKDGWMTQQKQWGQQKDKIYSDINLLEKEQLRLESKLEKYQEQLDQLIAHMWDTYELTYHAACEIHEKSKNNQTFSQQALQNEIAKKKEQIKQLGTVNANAIEDYQALSQRFTQMKQQQEDLLVATEKLKEMIAQLEEQMKLQFRQQFIKIEQQFQTVFAALFGGGKAKLQLLDETDLLGSDIQIVVQPPGKKLQNMMQLSGGEKALTAISLLFAIQNLKPSPFCLLDEIEAALDDANVNRYAEYLKNLTKHTQFIIITHRRGTMAIADTLYGVTMQEKGISTVVSVKFVEGKVE